MPVVNGVVVPAEAEEMVLEVSHPALLMCFRGRYKSVGLPKNGFVFVSGMARDSGT